MREKKQRCEQPWVRPIPCAERALVPTRGCWHRRLANNHSDQSFYPFADIGTFTGYENSESLRREKSWHEKNFLIVSTMSQPGVDPQITRGYPVHAYLAGVDKARRQTATASSYSRLARRKMICQGVLQRLRLDLSKVCEMNQHLKCVVAQLAATCFRSSRYILVKILEESRRLRKMYK